MRKIIGACAATLLMALPAAAQTGHNMSGGGASHDMKGHDMKGGAMKGGAMTETDHAKMASCAAMTREAAMKDAGCAAMKKAHSDTMKHEGMKKTM